VALWPISNFSAPRRHSIALADSTYDDPSDDPLHEDPTPWEF